MNDVSAVLCIVMIGTTWVEGVGAGAGGMIETDLETDLLLWLLVLLIWTVVVSTVVVGLQKYSFKWILN